MRYIDLFAGIGGFRLGLEKAGHECVWSNEWDKYANAIYKKHFGECDIRDIRTVEPSGLPDFDLLVGGFPCQSFSIAGKRGGFDDTRGTLFFEIARILEAKRPSHCLLENVRGLLSHDGGETFGRIVQTLGELGYIVEWQNFNSKHFGVPQNRERVFIHGFRKGSGRQIFPLTESYRKNERTTAETAYSITSTYHKGGRGSLIQLNNPRHSNDRYYSSDGISPTLNTMQGGHRQPKIHSLQPRSPDRPSLQYSSGGSGHLSKEDGTTYCLDTGNTQAIELDERIRKLTPIECERLQSFPDNWTAGFSDSVRYKCLGNAVTVNVIEALGKALND